MPSGVSVPLRVPAHFTIDQVMDAIQKETGTPYTEQRLIYGGKQLEKGSLYENNIEQGAKLELLMRVYGEGKRGRVVDKVAARTGAKRENMLVFKDRAEATLDFKVEHNGSTLAKKLLGQAKQIFEAKDSWLLDQVEGMQSPHRVEMLEHSISACNKNKFAEDFAAHFFDDVKHAHALKNDLEGGINTMVSVFEYKFCSVFMLDNGCKSPDTFRVALAEKKKKLLDAQKNEVKTDEIRAHAVFQARQQLYMDLVDAARAANTRAASAAAHATQNPSDSPAQMAAHQAAQEAQQAEQMALRAQPTQVVPSAVDADMDQI